MLSIVQCHCVVPCNRKRILMNPAFLRGIGLLLSLLLAGEPSNLFATAWPSEFSSVVAPYQSSLSSPIFAEQALMARELLGVHLVIFPFPHSVFKQAGAMLVAARSHERMT